MNYPKNFKTKKPSKYIVSIGMLATIGAATQIGSYVAAMVLVALMAAVLLYAGRLADNFAQFQKLQELDILKDQLKVLKSHCKGSHNYFDLADINKLAKGEIGPLEVKRNMEVRQAIQKMFLEEDTEQKPEPDLIMVMSVIDYIQNKMSQSDLNDFIAGKTPRSEVHKLATAE